ncbi:Fatty acid amide hydrolase [Cucurbita argyrosperma subsp. argyrosperma]|nr:Fatty acid amide hydrolase [Cucurbita argyrosperma subsp. argyrosperma]
MDLFNSRGVAYKPAKDVDLSPTSSEFYLTANVKAPRMVGIVVKIFAWVLEMRILGKLLLYVLKANNLIYKLVGNAEIEESPVAERFIAAVSESSKPPLNMSFFINYNVEDILKQAAESTNRYEHALIVGKTNMHELGIGTSGINPHHGSTRNPYNTSRICGGSSSGSAAIVAAGLCPAALGVDGGGSVRIPASLCGVVGLKPTFGRVPHSGVLPLNWTVGMVGILAATIEDAFIPKLCFPLLNTSRPIPSVTMAKYGEWFNDCSDDIRICCSNALDKLQKHHGWKTVEVTIPEIEVMRLAHYSTIASECSTALSSYLEKLDSSQLGWDARVALAVYGSFGSKEYIKAQKIRYSIAGNFLGLPAVTVPIGYDKTGLPIGLQFIGKPWCEATLIHIAYAMQALCVADYKKPEVFYDLLTQK